MQDGTRLPAGAMQRTVAFSNASEIIRTVETLNGRNDVGVQDFIKSVKRARSLCSQPDLLLFYILTEKIVDNAKRSIRHISINNYEDLYQALQTNLNSGTSVELCRAKLNSCVQGSDGVQTCDTRSHVPSLVRCYVSVRRRS